MARSDLLVGLVQHGLTGDKNRFKKTVEAIIAEERQKQHNVLAERLSELLASPTQEVPRPSPVMTVDQRIDALVREVAPQRRLEHLVLDEGVLRTCREVVQEHNRKDLLRSYNLEPRNRILLIGPPGNGKTSLAEAIAEALMLPMYVVRYDGVVGTFLGETANRLRRLVEYASTRNCVLFFDEFETIGKERGDTHETGEIKRVVSSLLMQIDNMPSHVMVIAATNHPELLDRAAWRRFQVRMNLPQPSQAALAQWFSSFSKRMKTPLGLSPDTLAKRLAGSSFADAEEFGMTVFRKWVLEQPNANLKAIVSNSLNQWPNRSLKASEKPHSRAR